MLLAYFLSQSYSFETNSYTMKTKHTMQVPQRMAVDADFYK